MKQFLAILLTLAMCFGMAACASAPAEPEEPEEPDIFAKSEGVMTHEEFVAAPAGSEVVVETFVQAAQAWWDGKLTAYTQDDAGGYFLRDLNCSEEDAALLVPGAKIKATGTKGEESGEICIENAVIEFEEGEYIAPAADVTALLGSEDMIRHQNEYVSFKDMTVSGEAVYKWDGSGADGDDLYFELEKDGFAYTFMVASYLTGAGTEVYERVKSLKAGDTVDVEAFCYWYEGIMPHVTGITKK